MDIDAYSGEAASAPTPAPPAPTPAPAKTTATADAAGGDGGKKALFGDLSKGKTQLSSTKSQVYEPACFSMYFRQSRVSVDLTPPVFFRAGHHGGPEEGDQGPADVEARVQGR